MMRTTDIAVGMKKHPMESLSAAISKLPQPLKFSSEVSEVVIKPSIYNPKQVGNTSLEMMTSVANLFGDVANLLVIESDNPLRTADEAFQELKYTEALSGCADFINLSSMESIPVEFPGHYFERHSMPKMVVDSRFMINLATLKFKPRVGALGASVKNLFGLLSEKEKSLYHPNIDQVLLDLLTCFKPQLTILELTEIVIGPREKNRTEFIGGVIVGTDPVAIDSYCAKLCGLNPLEIPYLAKAHESGLGQAIVDNITVHGTDHQKWQLEKRLLNCLKPKGI